MRRDNEGILMRIKEVKSDKEDIQNKRQDRISQMAKSSAATLASPYALNFYP